MKFILEQLTKIKNEENGEIVEQCTDADPIQIITTNKNKIFTVASNQAYSDSAASNQVGKITKTVSLHATCKELGFQRREAGIRLLGLKDKLNIYEVVIL